MKINVLLTSPLSSVGWSTRLENLGCGFDSQAGQPNSYCPGAIHVAC